MHNALKSRLIWSNETCAEPLSEASIDAATGTCCHCRPNREANRQSEHKSPGVVAGEAADAGREQAGVSVSAVVSVG